MNEMRDRLYDLLGECEKKYSAYYEEFIKQLDKAETQADFEKIYDGIIKKHDFFADHLIESGVIVPPCKVGQIVYIINDFDTEEPYVLPVEVVELGQSKNGQWIAIDLPLGLKISRYISWDNIGKDIFFTKEQAEQKLKEMRGE